MYITNNILHNHTDNSLGDGSMTVEEFIQKLKENGATAAAITDHGTASGWLDFFNAATAEGIKPILGVEAYMPEHLIALAKDYSGFQALSMFITETNRNLNSKGKPCGTKETLAKFFGKGSVGYGHVVMTSACIGGVVAEPFLYNFKLQKEIGKIEKRMEAVAFPEGYDEAAKKLQQLDAEIEKLKLYIAEQKKVSEKKFKKSETAIKKMADGDEKVFLLQNLQKEKEESERAKEALPGLREQLKELTASGKPYKAVVSKAKEKKAKLAQYKKQIAEIQSEMLSEEEQKKRAVKEAEFYKNLLPDGDFYIELQNHGIDKEEYIYPRLAQVAKEMDIPVIAANDAHFAVKEDADKLTDVRNAARISQTNAKWRPASDGDDQMYVKTGEELAEALLKILPEDIVDEAMRNIDAVCEKCNLELSDEKHYPKFENAKELLRKRCEEGILKRYPLGGKKVFTDAYRAQMEYELGIIDKMGFNDYFCEVADFIDYAKNSADNSIEIGPGRGSGAGSIVCYLCNITELDPMEYGLMFERFLNPERVTMPDIDTDFSAHAREICIKYVKEKYGERSIAGIMTKNRMAPKSAMDYAGKLHGLQNHDDKGYFSSLVARMKKLIPDTPGITIAKVQESIRAQFADDEDALEILKRASKLEGIMTSYGTHAAGIIIGDGTDLENYIPLMIASDDDGVKTWVIQADMVQAEAQLGFIKMDFLGLKTLNILTAAMRLVTRDYGIKIDPYNLPIEKEVFENIYAKGFTDYVFQFESDGMKDMLRQFKPTCFEDIIILVAMYRPGPMDFIPDVIEVKNGRKEMTFLCPQLEPILSKTYGAIVYQEQIIEICRSLAGFSMAQADNVRRFMSKKKTAKMEAERKPFIYGDPDRNICGCVANGIDENVANTLFDQMIEFAKYAFNKSHAAAYALVSYQTAWFKYHYFKEFVCAAMATQTDKINQLVRNCKAMNVPLYMPDINKSMEEFDLYDDGIIFGLKAIKGLKSSAKEIINARNEKGAFISAEDFVTKCRPDAGTLKAVVLSGALDTFTKNRKETLAYLSDFSKRISDLETVNNKVASLKEKLAASETDKEKAKVEKDIESAERLAEEAKNDVLSASPKKVADMPLLDKLQLEMDFLGTWMSGNPLDSYCVDGYAKISAAKPAKSWTTAGVVTNLRNVNRKSDGAPMAFFSLVDRDGNDINVCCFTEAFAKYEQLISEGAVLSIEGNVVKDEENSDDGKTVYEIFARKISVPSQKKKAILFSVENFNDQLKLMNILTANAMPQGGYPFKVYNRQFGEIRKGSFLINPSVMERKAVTAEMISA